MIINVVILQTDGTSVVDPHEADWLAQDSRDGDLRITRYDIHGTMLSWALYAAGRWLSAHLVEPASDEVLRARQAREERDRSQYGPPPNGSNAFGQVAY